MAEAVPCPPANPLAQFPAKGAVEIPPHGGKHQVDPVSHYTLQTAHRGKQRAHQKHRRAILKQALLFPGPVCPHAVAKGSRRENGYDQNGRQQGPRIQVVLRKGYQIQHARAHDQGQKSPDHRGGQQQFSKKRAFARRKAPISRNTPKMATAFSSSVNKLDVMSVPPIFLVVPSGSVASLPPADMARSRHRTLIPWRLLSEIALIYMGKSVMAISVPTTPRRIPGRIPTLNMVLAL